MITKAEVQAAIDRLTDDRDDVIRQIAHHGATGGAPHTAVKHIQRTIDTLTDIRNNEFPAMPTEPPRLTEPPRFLQRVQ